MFYSLLSFHYYFKLLKKEREKKSKLESISSSTNSKQKCRICLKQGTVAIFGDGSTPDITEVVRKYGDIEVNKEDNYPKHLCIPCLELLEGAVLFRRRAKESDHILRTQISSALKRKHNISFNDFDNDSFASILQTKPQNKTLINSFRNIPQIRDQKDNNKLKKSKKLKNKRNSDSLSSIEDQPEADAESSEPSRIGDYFSAVYWEDKVVDEKTKEERIVRKRNASKLQCKQCDKVITKRYAKYHINVHRQIKMYMCEICGKTFSQQCTYYTHVTIHRKDFQYMCTKCPYRSNTSGNLKSHMRTHTRIHNYECSECFKKFLFKSNLTRHYRNHSGRQYKCDYCNKSFYSKAYLQSHIEVLHLGHKDHVCEYCGAAFGFRKRMLAHQTEVHNRKKQPYGRTPFYLVAQIEDRKQNIANSDN